MEDGGVHDGSLAIQGSFVRFWGAGADDHIKILNPNISQLLQDWDCAAHLATSCDAFVALPRILENHVCSVDRLLNAKREARSRVFEGLARGQKIRDGDKG